MVWAASGCTSVQNAELRVSVLVEAVSLGSLLVKILVVNVDICHPYLTVVMVFLRCPLVHLENLSLYCLNPIHHTEASPSCWHCFSCFWLAQFISHLVFAAFLTLGTRTAFECPSFTGCGCVVCYPNAPRGAVLVLCLTCYLSKHLQCTCRFSVSVSKPNGVFVFLSW